LLPKSPPEERLGLAAPAIQLDSWGFAFRCRPAALKDLAMTVFVYVNTSKQVDYADHIEVFANQDAAETWFEKNDPEGVAFEYEVLE
jgi:hypothetical protein